MTAASRNGQGGSGAAAPSGQFSTIPRLGRHSQERLSVRHEMRDAANGCFASVAEQVEGFARLPGITTRSAALQAFSSLSE